MKKFVLLSFLLLIAACSEMSALTGSSSSTGDSTTAKMKACLTAEASSRYQAGTLFTNSVKETATALVKTCAQKLALQSAGISSETQQTAENIISNLKTLANNQ